jgi:hypothetical protein
VPSSVDSTGSTDVTSTLLEFISTVPDGSIVRFTPAGKYRIDGTIELDGRNDLVIDGNGATFFTNVAGASDRSHWRFFNGSNLTIENMIIRGASTVGGTSGAFVASMQWQHGVDIRGVNGFQAHGITVSDIFGDCFYMGIGSGGTWAANVHIYGNTCLRNGRQGVAVSSGRDVEVDHNTFGSIALMTIDLEPNGTTGGASNVYVHDNTIGTGPRQQALGMIANGPITGITFTANTLVSKSLTVYAPANVAARIQNVTITNNTSDTGVYASNGAAMELSNVDGLTITGNYDPLSGPNMAMVDVTGGCRLAISGNVYPGGVAEYRNISPAC